MNLPLEMKIEDAMFRLKDLYDRTDGKSVISFSGGKDSTVIAELYLMAKEKGLVGHMNLIFADTQIEYDAIYEFVEWYSKNKQEVVYIKPRLPFPMIIKKYGKPAMSKIKSDFLNTYQNTLKKGEDPLKVKRTSELLIGFRTDKEYNIKVDENGKPEKTRQRLANKHMHFVHPENEIKISSMCCELLKKEPFEDYYKTHGIKGYVTGMRKSEGGVREEMYKTCTAHKTIGRGKNKVKLIHKMPLFDWTDKDVDDFIEKYNVKISKAYTEYGLNRTGCVGCPFARDICNNLKVLYNHEPNKYKAVQHWLGDIYKDLEIDLPFDKTYTQLLKERKPIIEQRRYEMVKLYRENVSSKWKPKKTLFDFKASD